MERHIEGPDWCIDQRHGPVRESLVQPVNFIPLAPDVGRLGTGNGPPLREPFRRRPAYRERNGGAVWAVLGPRGGDEPVPQIDRSGATTALGRLVGSDDGVDDALAVHRVDAVRGIRGQPDAPVVFVIGSGHRPQRRPTRRRQTRAYAGKARGPGFAEVAQSSVHGRILASLSQTGSRLNFATRPAVVEGVQRTELVDALAHRTGLDATEADRILRALLEVVAVSLACGEDVALRGFGTLRATSRSRPQFRHPGTGVVVEDAAPEPRVSFRPSANLKRRMRAGRAQR